MPAEPSGYSGAMDRARQILAQARLEDPDEHFPYKTAAVLGLIEEDPPMGPGMPGRVDGADDRSREVGDYITEDIALASEAYIDAQAAYLADPTDTNRQAYDAARDQLVAARLDHRQNRGTGFTIGAAARKGS